MASVNPDAGQHGRLQLLDDEKLSGMDRATGRVLGKNLWGLSTTFQLSSLNHSKSGMKTETLSFNPFQFQI